MAPVRLGPAERMVLYCLGVFGIKELTVAELIEYMRTICHEVGKNYKQANGISKAASRGLKRLYTLGFLEFRFYYHGETVQSRTFVNMTAAALQDEQQFNKLHERMIDSLSTGIVPKSLAHSLLAQGTLDRDSLKTVIKKELEQTAQSGLPSRKVRIQTVILTAEGFRAADEIMQKHDLLARNIEWVLDMTQGLPLSDQSRAIARLLIFSGGQNG